jgi:hypothetical protein
MGGEEIPWGRSALLPTRTRWSTPLRSSESRAIQRLQLPEIGGSQASVCRVFLCVFYWSRLSGSSHNPKVEGSNPSPATNKIKELGEPPDSFFLQVERFTTRDFFRHERGRQRNQRQQIPREALGFASIRTAPRLSNFRWHGWRLPAPFRCSESSSPPARHPRDEARRLPAVPFPLPRVSRRA